jgi:hypothetical protein
MKTLRLSSIYIIFLFCSTLSIIAQYNKSIYSGNFKVETEKYEVVDIAFHVKKMPADNPFTISFGAIFENTDKQNSKITGFYNGNSEWIIRFSSNKIGIHHFETFSTLTGLSGLKGIISVKGNSEINQHGAVILNPENPQRFSYEDNTSYFALAFELDWLFALDFKNKNDIPRTMQIIKDIKDNGFNQVVMNVFAYDVQWPTEQNVPLEYEYSKPAIFPFKGTNEEPEFSELNTDFFKHFDRVIQHLHEQGLIAHIMIYVWNKKVSWPEMYSKEDNQYFDYVISRYQAYSNIIWDISKEALDYGRCDIPYINERISRIRKNDVFKRLITVHDYEYCSREPDKVDFISVQNWRSDIYSQMMDVCTKYRYKPILNIEHGGYETGPYKSFPGNYSNPETCLIRNYECIFAGVYSTYYWQNTAWNIVVFDPFRKDQVFAPPRFDYYKNISILFNRYDFNTLFSKKPKLTTNSREGFENLSSSGYSLTNGKDLFLFFIPDESDHINTILPKPENGRIDVTWFNPYTGEFIDKGSIPWSGWQEFNPPWENIACVLIIKTRNNM